MGRTATGSTSPDALELAPGIQPWKQQPGEPDGSYARFVQYLKLHPLVRKNPQRVYEELLKHGDSTITSAATIANMASLNQWQIRARAYDEHRAEREEEALEIASRKWADTLARRRVEIQTEHLDVSSKLVTKALDIIDSKDPEDGSFAEAARLVELAYKIQRDTLQLDRPPVSTDQAPEHVAGLSEDQTADRLRRLADELARRMNPTAAAAPDVVDAEVIPEPRDSSDDLYTTRTDPWEPAERPAIGPA